MKKIKIKSLELKNFKGIRKLKIESFGDSTDIFGANASGKTTLFDAFTWLLFGKDTTGRSDSNFEIKTLDRNSNVIPKIEHAVTAVLDVDGENVELQRILKEKWVTKRGSADSVFSGNITDFNWNGVPLSAGDYANKINLLISENVSKLITNPLAFNGLKWQDQRQVLLDITGGVTDEDVAKGNESFNKLLSKLANLSLEEFKKERAAKRKRIRTELDAIPTRLDEVEQGKPEPQDYGAIETQLKEKQKELDDIDGQVEDVMKAHQAMIDEKNKIKTSIQKLDFQISDIKHNIRKDAQDQFRKQHSDTDNVKRQIIQKESELATLNASLKTLQTQRDSKKNEMEQLSKDIVSLRTTWEYKNAEVISTEGVETACPTCKQSLPEGEIEKQREELETALKNKKQSELDALTQKGKGLKETLDSMSQTLASIDKRIEDRKSTINTMAEELGDLKNKVLDAQPTETKSEDDIYESLLSEDKTIEPIKKEVENLNAKLGGMTQVDISELKDKRDSLKTDVQHLEIKLATKKDIAKHDARIKELMEREKELAQQAADIEGEQFVIENFEKAKSEAIESLANSKFSLVNFKLFETQINGGVVPTCKALIDGVPFRDANNAAKINAGIDIINTLCRHYEVSAPIFIDNRESVTELIYTPSQIINLIVSEADATLRVVAEEAELETV